MARQAMVITFLACIFIDGCPSHGMLHRRAKHAVQPAVRALGIYQGGWSVFAPEVDRENFHLEFQVEYDDGSRKSWRSPEWPRLGPWVKLARFRELEYTEALRMNNWSRARPELARYLAERLKPHANARPVWVELTSHSVQLEPPTDEPYQPRWDPPEHQFVEVLYEEWYP